MQHYKTPLKAPFAWIGGKSKLADDIVALFPDHRLYVEVFGGALNVLYHKPRTIKQAEVVNDINGELINLHRAIRIRAVLERQSIVNLQSCFTVSKVSSY